MTSELIVMNRESVILAADSAMTLGNGKIFNSANKIFRLTPNAPVGIMIYNNAAYMGIPWETIIKLYRDSHSIDKSFDTVEAWKTDFVEFISSLPTDAEANAYFISIVDNILQVIESQVNSICSQILARSGEVSRKDINCALDQVVDEIINGIANSLRGKEIVQYLDEGERANFNREARTEIRRRIANNIDADLLSPQIVEKIESIVVDHFLTVTRDGDILRNDLSTGIVITGFGDQEWFPAFYSFITMGKMFGQLLLCNDRSGRIGLTQTDDVVKVKISVFAQADMVRLFMNGIDHGLFCAVRDHDPTNIQRQGPSEDLIDLIERELQTSDLVSTIDEPTKQRIMAHIQQEQRAIHTDLMENVMAHIQQHSGAVVDIVTHLPKDELGTFAETLVNLTSFKRRISQDSETVGGPIDVAVISKKDGFIWLKRKHYFDAALNPHFVHEILHSTTLRET